MTDGQARSGAVARRRAALVIAIVAFILGGGLTLTGWILDPGGNDDAATLGFRLTGGALGLLLFLGAAGLALKAAPRWAAVYFGGAILAGLGSVDALLTAADMRAWVRNLAFLLAGILLAALILGQLRLARKRGAQGILDFAAKNWALVGIVLFLVVARIAADEPLRRFFPTLVINATFLLALLSTLSYLVFRYLKQFGSPVSWQEAGRHQQEVQVLADPEMEGMRGVIVSYVDRGEMFGAYADLMRRVARAAEAPPATVDAPLSRPPADLSPGVPASPAAARIGAALLCTIAVWLPTMGVLADRNAGQGVAAFLLAAALGLPLAEVILRPRRDPPLAAVWLCAGLPAAVLSFILMGSAGLVGLLGPALALVIYGGRGAWLAFRPSRAAQDASTAHKVEAGRRHAKRGGQLRWAGVGSTSLAVAYPLARLALASWVRLPDLGTWFLAGLALAGLLLAAAGHLMAAVVAGHRERLDALWTQERHQRNGYHLMITRTIEGTSA